MYTKEIYYSIESQTLEVTLEIILHNFLTTDEKTDADKWLLRGSKS